MNESAEKSGKNLDGYRVFGSLEVAKSVPLVKTVPRDPAAAVKKLHAAIANADTGGTHANVLVPEKALDLKALGFKPTRLALPMVHEGVSLPVTWRAGTLHAHKVPGYYLVHEDNANVRSVEHIRHDFLPAVVAKVTGKEPVLVRSLSEKTAELAEDGKHQLQGHIDFQGLRIAVENRKGSVRSGTTPDGHKWRTVMRAPYGYIEAPAKGKDGDSIDVYVGPDKKAPNAFVVHQHKPDGTGHDEDKVMLGCRSVEDAKRLYLKHYDDPKFMGLVSTVSVGALKKVVGAPRRIPKLTDKFVSGAVGKSEVMI